MTDLIERLVEWLEGQCRCDPEMHCKYCDAAAEVAALREDAERYRWLRSPQSGQAGWWHIKYNVDPVKIDAAIDAARAAALAPAKDKP